MTGRAKSGIVLLTVAGAINFSDKAIIGLASVPIQTEFHLTAAQWGLVGSAFFALFSLSSLGLPFLSARIGAQKMLGSLALIWAFVQFITILPIKNFLFLIGTRVVLGAGEGPFYGLSVHLAAVWTTSDRRSFTFGVLTLGSAIGPALLSPVLAFLIIQIGWRTTFGVLGALGLLWCLVWWRNSRSLRDTTTIVPPRGTKSSLLSLLSPTGIFTLLAGLGGYWYLALLVVWIPQYFSESRHLFLNSPQYLLAVSLPWLGGAMMQMVVNLLSDHLWRSTRSMRIARVFPLASCLILGAALFALAVVVPTPLEAIFCLSLSPIGASFSLVAVILGENQAETTRGHVQGIGVAFYSLAGLVAPAVTGLIIQRLGVPSHGFAVAFLVGASIIAIFGVFCWLFVRPIPFLDPLSPEKEASLVTESL